MNQQKYEVQDQVGDDDNRQKYAHLLNETQDESRSEIFQISRYEKLGLFSLAVVFLLAMFLLTFLFIFLSKPWSTVLSIEELNDLQSEIFGDEVQGINLQRSTESATCQPQGQPLRRFRTRNFGKNNYILVIEPPVDWMAAVKTCESKCLVLTSIETFEEFNFLKDFIDELNSAWIGGTIRNRSQFEWIADRQVVQNFVWRKGEPSNPFMEKCIDLYTHRVPGANDNRCDDILPFICKSRYSSI